MSVTDEYLSSSAAYASVTDEYLAQQRRVRKHA